MLLYHPSITILKRRSCSFPLHLPEYKDILISDDKPELSVPVTSMQNYRKYTYAPIYSLMNILYTHSEEMLFLRMFPIREKFWRILRCDAARKIFLKLLSSQTPVTLVLCIGTCRWDNEVRLWWFSANARHITFKVIILLADEQNDNHSCRWFWLYIMQHICR